MSPLHVITAVFNPRRFASRYRLYRQFCERVFRAGVKLTTIECAFGERPFEVTRPDDPNDIQVRTSHELWHKERLLNLAIQRLPASAKYIAWIDADVHFTHPRWAEETMHQLQHYAVVQMFSNAHMLCPQHQIISSHVSMVRGFREHGKLCWSLDAPQPGAPSGGLLKFHPGLAWAARREALDELGGLIDFCIAGSADTHMLAALLGQVRFCWPEGLSPAYYRKLLAWAGRAERAIRGNVGHVPGDVHHFWHGKLSQRGYHNRFGILARHGFCPDEDLLTDTNGLLAFSGRNPQLEYDLRKSFDERNEDSIDV